MDLSQDGNYSVAVIAVIPGVQPDCYSVDTRPFRVPPCDCPSLTGLTATPSSGSAPLTVNFQASVTNSGAIVPDAQGNLYHWDFGDGTTADTPTPNTSHTYTNTGTFAATVTVNVPPGCPATAASTGVTVTEAEAGEDSDFNFCAALLIIAIALQIIGSVLGILGICMNIPWLWIAGAIVGGIGLLLFIVWVIFCSATTPCDVMRTVHCVLFALVAVVGPIMTVIASIFGGVPCGIAAAAAWGGWGTLYAWLGFVMRNVGCQPTC